MFWKKLVCRVLGCTAWVVVYVIPFAAALGLFVWFWAHSGNACSWRFLSLMGLGSCALWALAQLYGWFFGAKIATSAEKLANAIDKAEGEANRA